MRVADEHDRRSWPSRATAQGSARFLLQGFCFRVSFGQRCLGADSLSVGRLPSIRPWSYVWRHPRTPCTPANPRDRRPGFPTMQRPSFPR